MSEQKADGGDQQPRSGSSVFRPRARLIRTLGRDLIQNEVVALQELVKNAYDADARRVTLTFKGPMAPGKGELVVADDGHGMSLDVVRNSWMEPATIDKVRRTHSPEGRRVTGEKGIGRFAAARVAEGLVIESTTENPSRRVRVEIDWGSFEDTSKYLDEVHCDWEEGPAPPGATKGTRLRLIGLRESWRGKAGQKRLEDLRTRLSRLVSPFEPDVASRPEEASQEAQTKALPFAIHLRPPTEFKDLGGRVEPPSVLSRPHYRLKGHVTADGTLSAHYEIRERTRASETAGEIHTVEGSSGEVTDDQGNRRLLRLEDGSAPNCGPFDFEFRIWDRRPEDLKPLAEELDITEKKLRQDLNSQEGISVYRDKFRVAFPKSDWLGLDLRRVNNPTMALSNNQVVGVVAISADENPGLVDQSNRQALQDTQEYESFQELLIQLLNIIETKRYAARRIVKPERRVAGIFQKLDLAPLHEYVEKHYPRDAALKREVGQAVVQVKEGATQAQEVISRYRRLATLGTIMDRLLHEGRTPLGSIESQVDLIGKDQRTQPHEKFLGKLSDRLATIRRQTSKLKDLFGQIEPFSGRKRSKNEDCILEDLVRGAISLHQKNLKDAKIEVDLSDSKTPFRCHPGDMEGIFLNLLDNAIYWLKKKPEGERRISISIDDRGSGIRVVFSDSGPGVPSDIQDFIWDAYFSNKPSGVGLGLSIVGETMLDYEGSLELVGGGPLPGATFELIFKKPAGTHG